MINKTHQFRIKTRIAMPLGKSEVFTHRFQNIFQDGWTHGASADIHSILSSPEIFTS